MIAARASCSNKSVLTEGSSRAGCLFPEGRQAPHQFASLYRPTFRIERDGETGKHSPTASLSLSLRPTSFSLSFSLSSLSPVWRLWEVRGRRLLNRRQMLRTAIDGVWACHDSDSASSLICAGPVPSLCRRRRRRCVCVYPVRSISDLLVLLCTSLLKQEDEREGEGGSGGSRVSKSPPDRVSTTDSAHQSDDQQMVRLSV